MKFLKLTTIIFSCLLLIGCIHKKLPNEFSVNFEECCIKTNDNSSINKEKIVHSRRYGALILPPPRNTQHDYEEYNKFCNYKMVILYKLYYSKFK